MAMMQQWAVGTNDGTSFSRGRRVAQYIPNSSPTTGTRGVARGSSRNTKYGHWKNAVYNTATRTMPKATGNGNTKKFNLGKMWKLRCALKREATIRYGHTGWNA